MQTMRCLVAVLLAGWLAGCATMFSGSEQRVRVRVTPEDATTTVNGEAPKRFGDAIALDRGRTHTIQASREGYEPRQVVVRQELNGWFLANLLWGPFFWVGMLVDAMTGSVNELSPQDISIQLLSGQAMVAGASPASPTPTGSSGSAGVTFVAPSGPSWNPLQTARGTGMQSRERPPAAAQPSPSPSTAPPTPTPTPTPSVQGQAPPQLQAPLPSVGRTFASSTQREWVLAVMNTEVAGQSRALTREIRAALTDQIRVFLAERGLRVIDRGSQEAAMKAIVDEEKAKSYKSCVDESCQIPLGKALAASHIMKSTIAVFGKACTTNGELIDLRAEVAVAAGSARSGCEAEDLLVAAEKLAEQMLISSARH